MGESRPREQTAAQPHGPSASGARAISQASDGTLSPLGERAPVQTERAGRRRAALPSANTSQAFPPESRTSTVASASSSRRQRSSALTSDTYRPVVSPENFASFSNISNVVGVLDYGEAANLMMRSAGSAGREMLAEPMVRCEDGRVRRFPRSNGGIDQDYRGQVQLGMIYDVDSSRISRRIGGIELLPDNRRAAFLVDGHPVHPIKLGVFTLYQLPGGKFMVPQPGFRDCSTACELMMLLDHQAVSTDGQSEATVQSLARRLDRRRTGEQIMSSLQSTTRRVPQLVEHPIRAARSGRPNLDKAAWRDLAAKINEMGPCILSNGGHDVMLDEVREEPHGNFFMTIREPFHGTVLEFPAAEYFGPRDCAQAIFLG